MKKILISVLIVGLAAIGIAYGTIAYFSDSETSTDNTFVAGAIDLKIGNDSYYNGVVDDDASWTLTDLTVEKYFNYGDLKPGDWGEDTIALEVNSNKAWACATITLTADDENTAVDPEIDAGDVADDTNDDFDGELASELHFVWWPDDGDNVLEVSEREKVSTFVYDKLSNIVGPDYTVDLTLSDSQWNFFENAPGATPLNAGTTYHIGKAWCFGDMELTPVADDTGVSPAVASGITCDGANVGNMSQTDTVVGDVTFEAYQYRNNESFLCPENQP